MANTFKISPEWEQIQVKQIQRMEKYTESLDILITGLMPNWLKKWTNERKFGWKVLGRTWARNVGLEIRLGQNLHFTEVYLKGDFVGSVKY